MVGRLIRPSPPLDTVRERWETPDGDFVDVDLTSDLSSTGRPIAALFHGLEGSASRSYMRVLMADLLRLGVESVAVNFRGCSGEANRLPRAYHSGDSGEAGWVAATLRKRWPGRSVGAAGFSLGGNVLLKYLGERGAASQFAAAAVVSVPFDLSLAEETISGPGIQRIYAQYFLRSLKAKVQAKSALLGTDTVRDALASRTLAQFDDVITAPLHGFQDAQDYYARCSSRDFLGSVAVPTLIVQALDDPFLPAPAIPASEIAGNAALFPMITLKGGHLGFLGGSPFKARWWGERALATFLAAALGAEGGGNGVQLSG